MMWTGRTKATRREPSHEHRIITDAIELFRGKLNAARNAKARADATLDERLDLAGRAVDLANLVLDLTKELAILEGTLDPVATGRSRNADETFEAALRRHAL